MKILYFIFLFPLSLFAQAPVNDGPCGAISIPVVSGSECTSPTTYQWQNASFAYEGFYSPTCGGFTPTSTKDVWFKFIATSTNASILFSQAYGISHDLSAAVYSAESCTFAYDYLGCDDDSGPDFYPQISLYNCVVGQLYFVRVWQYNSSIDSGSAKICVVSEPLGGANQFTGINTKFPSAALDVNGIMKIRGGVSKVGSINIDNYSLENTFGVANNFPFGSLSAYTVGNTLNNRFLEPEFTLSREAGLDIAFLKSRINLGITAYQTNTTNQTVNMTVSSTTGYTSSKINAGEMLNKGLEFELKTTPIATPNWRWDFNANYAYWYNKVVSLAGGLDDPAPVQREVDEQQKDGRVGGPPVRAHPQGGRDDGDAQSLENVLGDEQSAERDGHGGDEQRAVYDQVDLGRRTHDLGEALQDPECLVPVDDHVEEQRHDKGHRQPLVHGDARPSRVVGEEQSAEQREVEPEAGSSGHRRPFVGGPSQQRRPV